MKTLDEAIEDFVAASDELKKIVAELFPAGSVVRTKREGIFGIVLRNSGSECTNVQILMENGNVRDRVATSLERMANDQTWPTWVKQAKRPKA